MSDKNGVIIERFKNCVDKYTREEIAQSINCDTSLVTRHYNGDRTITLDYAVKYAKFFGVSVDYLVGITFDPTNDTDIRAICEYTGLSSEAVDVLKLLSELSNSLSNTINTFFTMKNYPYIKEIIGFYNEAISNIQSATRLLNDSILSFNEDLINTDFEHYFSKMYTEYLVNLDCAHNFQEKFELYSYRMSKIFDQIIDNEFAKYKSKLEELYKKQDELNERYQNIAVSSGNGDKYNNYGSEIIIDLPNFEMESEPDGNNTEA